MSIDSRARSEPVIRYESQPIFNRSIGLGLSLGFGLESYVSKDSQSYIEGLQPPADPLEKKKSSFQSKTGTKFAVSNKDEVSHPEIQPKLKYPKVENSP